MSNKEILQSAPLAAPRSCFIAMPFAGGGELHAALKHIVERECGLRCIRGDDIYGSSNIVADIWQQIQSARFVIADLSGRNANVFYELGLCHGAGKQAILLAQNISDVPFDLRDRRCVEYDASRVLDSLSSKLVPHVRERINTLPSSFRRVPSIFQATSPGPANVLITDLVYPDSATTGQPFEITVKATNFGRPAKQGYFSLSFPDGVDDLKPSSEIKTKVGHRGDRWGSGRIILSYTITEAFRYSDTSPSWDYGHEYSLTVQARARRSGLFWFYASSSCEDCETGEWQLAPATGFLDLDQRNEPVYVGTIDVR